MKRVCRYALPLLLLLILLPAAILAGNGDRQDLFGMGNAAYSRGDYQKAISDYLKFARSHGVSASLLYNLANGYAAIGDTGKAVVNYERALRLAPGDQDIRSNLEQVRKDAGLYLENRPFYQRAAQLLEADQWALISGWTFFLLSLAVLLPLLTGGIPAFLSRGIILACLAVLVVTVPAALYRYREWNDGVIINDNARLLISPFASAASTGTIRAGRLVRPEKTHAGYLLVLDETGRSGWLKRTDIAFITEMPGQEKK